MKPQFVPFTLPVAPTAEDRAFTAKTVPVPAKDSAANLPGDCEKDDEVRVSLVKEGGQITGIRVHCGCGEVHELQCVYER